MAMEQYFQEVAAEYELNDDEASLKSWKSISPAVDESESNNSSGFDCNICLDSVQDPVITMCGHLYCWPCIYKWIHYQTTSSDNSDHHQQPQCPVCKLDVSEKTIIPLYGPGLTPKPSNEKVQNHGIVIPQRPPTPRPTELHYRSNPQPYPDTYRAAPVLSTLGGTRTRTGTGIGTETGLGINVSHPTVGMFGEMVYGRIFGNSETTVYTYPNSYHIASSASPRVRRHIVEVDKSLSRLCFFLFCCMILCLVLF